MGIRCVDPLVSMDFDEFLVDEKFCQINEFGAAASDGSRGDKEDEKGAALAARARLGDYDEGKWDFRSQVRALLFP